MPDESDALELAKAVADEVRDGIILCDHCGKALRINALPDAESLRVRFGISRREAEVAVLLADRRTDAEIAAALGISWHTVRSHVERIFRALGCNTRREAATKLKSPT